jgi:peroxiredoxin
VLCCALLSGGFFATPTFASAGQPVEAGTKAPEFSLNDVDGHSHALADFLKNKLTVVMFIATQCPVSNAYNTRMVKLDDDFGSRGVAFVGINSNKQEAIDEIRQHSKTNGFKFTVLKDPGNVVADTYGAQVTPEVYVIDQEGTVRYHGRIDNDRNLEEADTHDLRVALEALLAGNAPPRAGTKAFGCTIKRVKKES